MGTPYGAPLYPFTPTHPKNKKYIAIPFPKKILVRKKFWVRNFFFFVFRFFLVPPRGPPFTPSHPKNKKYIAIPFRKKILVRKNFWVRNFFFFRFSFFLVPPRGPPFTPLPKPTPKIKNI